MAKADAQYCGQRHPSPSDYQEIEWFSSTEQWKGRGKITRYWEKGIATKSKGLFFIQRPN
jgi:hypothetical protein